MEFVYIDDINNESSEYESADNEPDQYINEPLLTDEREGENVSEIVPKDGNKTDQNINEPQPPLTVEPQEENVLHIVPNDVPKLPLMPRRSLRLLAKTAAQEKIVPEDGNETDQNSNAPPLTAGWNVSDIVPNDVPKLPVMPRRSLRLLIKTAVQDQLSSTNKRMLTNVVQKPKKRTRKLTSRTLFSAKAKAAKNQKHIGAIKKIVLVNNRKR